MSHLATTLFPLWLALPSWAAAQSTCPTSPDPELPCCVLELDAVDSGWIDVTRLGPRLAGGACDGLSVPATEDTVVVFDLITGQNGELGRVEGTFSNNGAYAEVLKWRVYQGRPVLRTPQANIIIDITGAGLLPADKIDVRVKTDGLRVRHLLPPTWQLIDTFPLSLTFWMALDGELGFPMAGPMYPAAWE